MSITPHVHRLAARLAPLIGWALGLRPLWASPALGVALMGALVP
jgi:hypothetical protein